MEGKSFYKYPSQKQQQNIIGAVFRLQFSNFIIDFLNFGMITHSSFYGSKFFTLVCCSLLCLPTIQPNTIPLEAAFQGKLYRYFRNVEKSHIFTQFSRSCLFILFCCSCECENFLIAILRVHIHSFVAFYCSINQLYSIQLHAARQLSLRNNDTRKFSMANSCFTVVFVVF